MRGVRVGTSDACVHDLWSHRLLRKHERSCARTFEIKRPSANTTAAHFGQLLHMVLRLQRVFNLARLRSEEAAVARVVSTFPVLQDSHRELSLIENDFRFGSPIHIRQLWF